MNAQEQHTKKIGLNREPRFIRLGLDSRPKHGQSSLSARFIRNAAYTPGWYIVRRRSKFFEFHGTCANCSINVPITGSLLFPRTTARARARTSIPALSPPLFSPRPSPPLSPGAAPMEQESHGVFKLSFEGEHEANASAQMDPFSSRWRRHGTPGKWKPAFTIFVNVERSLEDGGM